MLKHSKYLMDHINAIDLGLLAGWAGGGVVEGGGKSAKNGIGRPT